MASVFTYDPDPPRVSSPWIKPISSPEREEPSQPGNGNTFSLGGLHVPSLTTLDSHSITFLEAEPQLGPVEYKLHLLLRPRQRFAYTSTGDPNTDPRAARPLETTPNYGTLEETAAIQGTATRNGFNGTSGTIPSTHTRQTRLEHLTTQLLWRLQQSSPYHASSSADLVIPSLPDASGGRLGVPTRPEKLLPGLEESQGAMYEIGVNDDGALIGLTQNEMSESLINLRAMAASLGCTVTILRAIVVGKCRISPISTVSASAPTSSSSVAPIKVGKQASSLQEDLLVVEALVLPDTSYHPNSQLEGTPLENQAVQTQQHSTDNGRATQDTEQLRVSLTGSTTSGKSSLMGTLLASTLDNARGKSRLNLLKHRHEIATGITSSVAHELLGYQNDGEQVINYACDNVESWTDVHNTAEGGRLVLLTDSAGHPRFRRTIVRSLVAWKPHWTLCCIAVSYTQDPAGLGFARCGPENPVDSLNSAQTLALAHLELCLKLDLPLVVVITKYDLATRQALKQILSRILDTLKAAGRVPQLLKPTDAVNSDELLQRVPLQETNEVRNLFGSVEAKACSLVPIVLTSAVTGAGITRLHALLSTLPLLPNGASTESEKSYQKFVNAVARPPVLFDVDEIFVKQKQKQHPESGLAISGQTYILSGLLERGSISVGDELLLGPFVGSFWSHEPRPSLHDWRAASYPVTQHEMATRRSSRFGPRRRRSTDDVDERPDLEQAADANDAFSQEWYKARVASLRNLRLPVQTTFEGQAATIGITFADDSVPSGRPRKGMVLLSQTPRDASFQDQHVGAMSCGSFQAQFDVDAYNAMEPGAQFNVYVGSIRGLVKAVSVGLVEMPNSIEHTDDTYLDDDVFQLEKPVEGSSAVVHRDGDQPQGKKIEVTFQLLNSREYIEVGAGALVMPIQAGEGAAGLDGHVGWISAVYG